MSPAVGWFALLICVVPITNSAKILAYYPTPSFSHQVVFRPLTNELVKRGHQVTVVTTDPQYSKGQTPKNLTEVDVHDLSYGIWKKHFLTRPAGVKDDLSPQMEVVFGLMAQIIEKQFNTPEVKKVISGNNKYDLVIVEAFPRQLLVLSHIFKVPLIQFSSLGLVLDNYSQLGIPQHELLYPTYFRRKLYNLTMWEKVTELYGVAKVMQFYHRLDYEENAMLKRTFGDHVPSTSDLANNIDMIFLNTHPIFEGIRPTPPNVIHVHGIHQKPEKELPLDLQAYLESSRNGIIYISFGTNVKPSLLPPERMQVLIKAMSELPYNVLWKWDTDVMANKSNNIKLTKWVPQSDLLKHPKVKLFITQGGLQSTDEAIEAGVPLIGIPMLGDQWFNTEKYVYHKIGLRLDMETMTKEDVKAAVDKVIGVRSFRQNIERLRSLMHDQPQKPLDRAIWWTEYVLRNGGAKHLRSPAANMSWREFLEIELVLTMLIGLVASCTVMTMAVCCVCKMMFKKKPKIKKN